MKHGRRHEIHIQHDRTWDTTNLKKVKYENMGTRQSMLKIARYATLV